MTILNNCPVCRGVKFNSFISCKDYTVSGEIFTIVECSDCGFKFTNPRPEDSVIGSYYKSEDYISHSDTKKGLVAKLYHFVRSYTLGKKESLLLNYVSRGTLLDYGCGTGMFLSHCKSQGWNVAGIEPDEEARALAVKNGATAFRSIDEFNLHNRDTFDAITLWHVLEHVSSLEGVIGFLNSRLKIQGILVVAVPNYTSHDARHYKEYWAAYDLPRHFYHFEVNSISRLFKNHGFQLVDTYPMKFDSFYVSLLSEKYKTGSPKLIKAFWRGLLSNLKARSASDYSSVIYVFKKAE